jgi:hypothetical protein
MNTDEADERGFIFKINPRVSAKSTFIRGLFLSVNSVFTKIAAHFLKTASFLMKISLEIFRFFYFSKGFSFSASLILDATQTKILVNQFL